MIILVLLIFLGIALVMKQWTSTAEPARVRTGNGLLPTYVDQPRRAQMGNDDSDTGQVWSALDELQLTRLLANSAPPTISETDLT